jgi:hypothetical protein
LPTCKPKNELHDLDYNDKKYPADDLPDEDVTAIDEIPVYSINKPKSESLVVLKILDNMEEGEQRPKVMNKGREFQGKRELKQ